MRRLLVSLLAISGWAQVPLPPPVSTDPGPIRPEIRVAPGQIVPLHLSGVRLLEPRFSYQYVNAPEGPSLPLSLAGVSVSISPSYVGPPSMQRAFEFLPILSIEQWPNLCTENPPLDQCQYSVITVHIPPDLSPSAMTPIAPQPALMLIRAAGRETARLPIIVDGRRPHILTSCDRPGPSRADSCIPILTSQSGRPLRTPGQMSGEEPTSGEVVIIYASGLGLTEPVAPVGRPVVRATPLRDPLVLHLDWLAENGNIIESQDVQPEYSGLAPGFVGLYQINMRIPDSPANVPACRCQDPAICGGGGLSNLRIGIRGPSRVETVEICTRPKLAVGSR